MPKWCSHTLPQTKQQALNISYIVWMVLSVYPSVCRWYVELYLNSVPIILCKLLQKPEMNLGSRSETIVTGIPCNGIILSTYNLANLSTDHDILTGSSLQTLVSLSTKTQMPLWPAKLGKPTIKSIAISSHFHCGMGKGCNKPPGHWCSTFTCW